MTGHSVYGRPHVVVVCGLAMEARIAAGEDAAVVCSGDRQRLAAGLRDVTTPSTCGIVSFGFAGGLASELRPGTCVVARSVLALGEAFITDPAWAHRIVAAVPDAVHAELAGVDRPIQLPSEKRALHTRTGAVAADMESHIAGRIARDRQLPFAAIRIIIDPAERHVPKSALAGTRDDGTAHARAVAAALMRRPRDIPAVMRLAFDAWIASRALLRCRRQLGERFAFVDIGHHPLDMA